MSDMADVLREECQTIYVEGYDDMLCFRDADEMAAALTAAGFGLVREQAAKLTKVEDLIGWLDAASADDEPLYAKGKVSARATAKMLRDAIGGKA